MFVKFSTGENEYTFDLSKPLFVSIPMNFYGNQPNTYNVKTASAKAYEKDGFIGDTRKGGGCNFEEYSLIPHCNGTHTECVGHISLERMYVNEILKDSFIASALITVAPEKAFETDDTYFPDKNKEDLIISKRIIEEKLAGAKEDFLEGLIIRTLPNDDSKMSRKYMELPPPFFSVEAMEYIDRLNVSHLLIDIPSVDRTFDEGKLTAHHIFWNVQKESNDVDKNNHSLKTITEMIYVPDSVKDGIYLTCIQIPDFKSDAAPSRIILYKENLKQNF